MARTETTTLGFTLDTIRALLEIDPQICFRWLRMLSDRLDGSQPRLLAIAGRSATGEAEGIDHHVELDADV